TLVSHHLHLYSFPTRRSSDLMYSYITPNYLTKTFSILKSNNYNQFLDKYRDDPFYESSWLLNELSEGKNRDLLKFKIFDGLFNKDRKSTRLNSSHVKISYAVF